MGNNPLSYTDPSGLCPWCIPVAIAALEAWNAYDTANDAVDTANVLGDKCSSGNDKLKAVGLFALGVIDPTPGNLGKKVAKGIPPDGLAFELKHLNKHLEGTAHANRLIRKEGSAHVFENKEALSAVEKTILEQGQFTGNIRGWDRYGLQFDSPIGYRIGADGSRTPLTYGEIKVKDGLYHVIPRSGAGQ